MKCPRTCPRCIVVFEQAMGSVSRLDNQWICSDCGAREAGIKPPLTEFERDAIALIKASKHFRRRT